LDRKVLFEFLIFQCSYMTNKSYVLYHPLCFSGTTLNYFLDNRINRAEILFPGVACFLVAVILGSAVHASNAADNEKKLSGSTNANKLG